MKEELFEHSQKAATGQVLFQKVHLCNLFTPF